MSREKNNRLIKTRKYYQECYERIGDDSHKAFNTVVKVVKRASRRYIPNEIASGGTYLELYAFSLVIEKQGGVTSEQNKILKIYFNNMKLPFSQSAYLNAAKTGAELGDFRRVISISKSYAGGFWVNFFRAIYKAGTQEELQTVVDCVTSLIMRFSVFGSVNNYLVEAICKNFVESVNYQIDKARELSIKEIDWLGVISIPDRLKEMKILYESLIDSSNITADVSKGELLPLLELLVLNCICDVVMMIKQPNADRLSMMNDAVALAGIHTGITPEKYLENITNKTELGIFYKTMFSSEPPLGSIWQIILIMGSQTNRTDIAIAVTNDILSILLQIENFLDNKYNCLGEESIAKNYMAHIVEQLVKLC